MEAVWPIVGVDVAEAALSIQHIAERTRTQLHETNAQFLADMCGFRFNPQDYPERQLQLPHTNDPFLDKFPEAARLIKARSHSQSALGTWVPGYACWSLSRDTFLDRGAESANMTSLFLAEVSRELDVGAPPNHFESLF